MSQINLKLDKATHKRFSTRCRVSGIIAQRLLRDFVEAYANQELSYVDRKIVACKNPIHIREDATRAQEPAKVLIPYDPMDPHSGPDITPKQYKHLCETMASPSNETDYVAHKDEYVTWIISVAKCNIDSVLAMWAQYPPNPKGPNFEKTKAFLEGVK